MRSGRRPLSQSAGQARAFYGDCQRADSGACDGLFKLLPIPSENVSLGYRLSAEDATELIHLGQMALQNGATIDRFIESIFSFPTFAEAYRVAALDILGQRRNLNSTTQAA